MVLWNYYKVGLFKLFFEIVGVEGLKSIFFPSRTRVEDRHQWFKLHNKLETCDICISNLSNTD